MKGKDLLSLLAWVIVTFGVVVIVGPLLTLFALWHFFNG